MSHVHGELVDSLLSVQNSAISSTSQTSVLILFMFYENNINLNVLAVHQLFITFYLLIWWEREKNIKSRVILEYEMSFFV